MLKIGLGKYKLSYWNSLNSRLFRCFSNLEGVYPNVENRKTHAYCLGLPRSGTHSLVHILSNKCRTMHEPMKKNTITYIINNLSKASEHEVNKWLLFRDKMLKVDVESSHFLHYFSGNLSEVFPEAKFILTIREPIGWLESELNVNYSASKSVYWRALEEYRYKVPSLAYELIDQKWQPDSRRINAYISYWKNHIKQIVYSVPNDRLLVMFTHEIDSSVKIILEFLGLEYQENDELKNVRKGLRKTKKIKLSDDTISLVHEIIYRKFDVIGLTTKVRLGYD